MGTGLNIELFKNHFESKYLFIPIPMNALRCIYGGFAFTWLYNSSHYYLKHTTNVLNFRNVQLSFINFLYSGHALRIQTISEGKFKFHIETET